MIRKTTLALAALAVASAASVSTANAYSYWPNYSFAASHEDCHWVKQKVFFGYDYDGKPIYRWKKVRICS